MFGRHPLSSYEGVSPVKDIMREYKGRETTKKEDLEMLQKCREIYCPPGIVVSQDSAFKKSSTVDEDIKKGVPKDNIFKRTKHAQHIAGGMQHFRQILPQPGGNEIKTIQDQSRAVMFRDYGNRRHQPTDNSHSFHDRAEETWLQL